MIFRMFRFVVGILGFALRGLAPSLFAALDVKDSQTINFDQGSLTLYMSQEGTSLFLDSRNTSGLPLSCQIVFDTTVLQRNNCQDIGFVSSATTLRIDVQFANDQASVEYNTRSQRFSFLGFGAQNMPSLPDYPYQDDTYNNTIQLTTSQNSYTTDQWISLNVKTYQAPGVLDISSRDTIDLSVMKRSGNYYYSVPSSQFSRYRNYYSFVASDRGSAYLSNYVRFSTPGDYKIMARNRRTAATSEVEVTVNTPQVDREASRLLLRVNTTSLRINEYLDTTLEIVDRYAERVTNYRGTLQFVLEKQDAYSSYWYQAPSYDYFISSPRVTMTSSQAGVVSLRDNIQISAPGNYRLRVYDTSNNSLTTSVTITVRTSSVVSTNLHYVGWTAPAVPRLYEYFDVNLFTRNQYNENITTTNDTIKLTLERKRLPESGIWTTVGVARDCSLRQEYITSSSSALTLSNLISCSKKGFYRLKLSNQSQTTTYGYIYFTLVDTQDFVRYLDGFSSAQRQIVQDEYYNFMNQVNRRNESYPNLARSTRREALWKDYYFTLNKLSYAKEGRLDNYQQYLQAKRDFDSSRTKLQ